MPRVSIAKQPSIRATLAWDVLAWCLATGGDGVRTAVAKRVEVLGEELTPRLPNVIGATDANALATFGVIDQDPLGEIASARIAAVQHRARTLIGAPIKCSVRREAQPSYPPMA